MARQFVFAPTIIPRRQYIALIRVIHDGRDFGPITRARVAGWNKLAKKLTIDYESPISAQQIMSIRSALLKQHVVQNYYRIAKLSQELSTKYLAGTDILTLSHQYNYPPLGILRVIFENVKKYRAADIRAIFVQTADPSDTFNGHDLMQYKKASSADILESNLQRRVHLVAARNERIFVDKFRKTGVQMRTQDDLVADQIVNDGKASLTPDLLFDEPVIINGLPVAWIDYKDYTGSPVGFLMMSNRKQAAKYTARWGPGAIFYNGGIVDGITIESTQLLDASLVFSAESL